MKLLIVVGCIAVAAQVLADPPEQAAAPPTQSVTVRGCIAHPGSIKWRSGLTVSDAVRMTGGWVEPEEDHYPTSIVVRLVQGKVTRVRAKMRTVLMPGDELTVGRDLQGGVNPRRRPPPGPTSQSARTRRP